MCQCAQIFTRMLRIQIQVLMSKTNGLPMSNLLSLLYGGVWYQIQNVKKLSWHSYGFNLLCIASLYCQMRRVFALEESPGSVTRHRRAWFRTQALTWRNTVSVTAERLGSKVGTLSNEYSSRARSSSRQCLSFLPVKWRPERLTDDRRVFWRLANKGQRESSVRC